MNTSIVKIISQIISQLSLTEYIYLPSGRKLGFLSAYDLLENNDLMLLINSPSINNLLDRLEILGVATKEESLELLHNSYGKKIIEVIIDNSSAKGSIELDNLLRKEYNI